jgi:large subunit ribosomal protein L13
MTAKTYTVRESEIERRWYVVDATDETLGRLASRIARVLEGKNKPTYSPTMDSGDHVVVVNAGKIAVTSERRPEEVIRRAVKGMLPHNRLGAQQITKLKVYAGPEHPHQAQRPEPLA